MSEAMRTDGGRPDEPAGRRAALRLEDWSGLDSLLDDEAVEKLQRAGWTIYFGKLSRSGAQSDALEGDPNVTEARAIEENLLSYHVRSSASREAKLSGASRKLCQFFGVDLCASPPPPSPGATERGGWALYENGRVALFLEASAYPDPASAGLIGKTDGGLSCVTPLSHAKGEIQREKERAQPGRVAITAIKKAEKTTEKTTDARKYLPELNSLLEFVYRHVRVCEATGRVEIFGSFHIVTDLESASFKIENDQYLLVEIDGDYEIRFWDRSRFEGKRLQAKLWNAMTGMCDFDCLGWEIVLYDDENVRRAFDGVEFG